MIVSELIMMLQDMPQDYVVYIDSISSGQKYISGGVDTSVMRDPYDSDGDYPIVTITTE